jgi:small subunit ribosomal protein S16
MLRIRLRRVGKKGKPSYRIVVADAHAPRDGAYVEWIGNYDPMADPPAISLKRDRAVQWLSQGAQPSDAVRRILDRDGILVRTPKFRAQPGVSEAPAGTPAPTVTITRAPAPAAVEVATVEVDTDVPEETVDEESAEEVLDQEASSDAPKDETEDEARSE